MGFISQLLQNAQQQQTAPQQSAQSRFGQSGLLESMRNLQPPQMPTNAQASQGGSAPFGGNFFGSGMSNILDALRQQLGGQGLGGMLQTQGPNGQIGYQKPEGAQMFGTGSGTPVNFTPGQFPSMPQPTQGLWNPRMPTPQVPQMPRFPAPTNTGITNINQMPGYTPTGPSMAPKPQAPSTPMINPQMPRPTIGMGTPTGGGFATPDPRPTTPTPTTTVQSKYGNLSGRLPTR